MFKLGNLNLLLYFIVAFAFSWIFWIPQVLVARGILLTPSIITDFLLGPFNPAAFGPLVSAFSLTYLNEGVSGLKSLLKRGLDCNFRKVWFIPIFLLFPVMTGSALLLTMLAGETPPELTTSYDLFTVAMIFTYIFFLGGPFQEEWGWRGYALDRLQERWSALTSSILLGLMWGLWHLPLFFMPGTIQSQTPFWGFMSLIICGSLLFTWIYNNTGGSILAVMLFHTMNNLSLVIFPTLRTASGGLYLLILNVVTAAIVLSVWGPKKLAHTNQRYLSI
ncbi:MAG: type II CAAX endopeptidase family protein [Zestosphaera sp.]